MSAIRPHLCEIAKARVPDDPAVLAARVLELERELADAQAVITAQAELLVRLQHPKPKRCDQGGFGHVNEAARPVF